MEQPDRNERRAAHGKNYVERFSSDRQRRRLAGLIGHMKLSSQADVLDLGCGTGLLARLLSSRIKSYTGVDFSQPMISAARDMAAASHLANCDFLCGDAVDVMRRHADGFDAIFALDIAEHIPDNEWQEIVTKARASLKVGGVFYLHTPNLDFFIERMKQVGILRQFPEHIAVRTVRKNLAFFVEAQYSEFECKTLRHYNGLRALHQLVPLPFLGRFFAARVWITAIK